MVQKATTLENAQTTETATENPAAVTQEKRRRGRPTVAVHKAKVKIRNRLDLMCVCTGCKNSFVLFAIDQKVKRDGVLDLSAMRCPVCNQSALEFTLKKLRVSENALTP